jgi:hypothetical protein
VGWWTTSTETWAGRRQLDVAEIVASCLLSPIHSTQRRFVAVDRTKDGQEKVWSYKFIAISAIAVKSGRNVSATTKLTFVALFVCPPEPFRFVL